LSETTITGSIIQAFCNQVMKLIVGIGGHCPEHSAASNKQFIVVFQSIIRGDFLGHRLSAASRVLSLAFTIIAFLEDGQLCLKSAKHSWIGSVPPAVVGGYVVDALDFLMFCEADPLPTRYRRWY